MSAAAEECKPRSVFEGRLGQVDGQQGIAIGWDVVRSRLADKSIMGGTGKKPNFGSPPWSAVPVMVLGPQMGDTSKGLKIDVTASRRVANIRYSLEDGQIGLMVLNQPFWVGVFPKRCEFVFENQLSTPPASNKKGG